MKITGLEYFQELIDCHNESNSIKDKYSRIRSLLEKVCKEITSNESIQFSNLFSRLNYVCEKTGLAKVDTYRINTLRIHANKVLHAEFNPTKEEYLLDLRALCVALSHFYKIAIPQYLLDEIPNSAPYKPYIRKSEKQLRIRVEVSSTDNEYIYVFDEEYATENPIKVKYNIPGVNEEFNPTVSSLWKGCQLNLIDVFIDENGIYLPDIIILEPDYLIDISSLAECMKEYGSHPLNYIQSKFEPIKNTKHILLGNAANYFLDEFVNEKSDNPVSYLEAMKNVFKSAPFEFSTCADLLDKENEFEFFQSTKSQYQNIQNTVNNTFPSVNIDRENGILEPNFICEQLGVQGRLDYLQLEPKEKKQFVIELKSGKTPFPETNFELLGKNHQAQSFIYQIIIQKVLAVNFKNLNTYVFYSKYSDSKANLRLATPYMKAIREILNIRNMIVANEKSIAFGGATNQSREIIKEITPDTLITNKLTNQAFLDKYIIPQIKDFISPFSKASALELEYFHSLYMFVTKEHYISKAGDTDSENKRGVSSLWLTPAEDKYQAGEIYTGLRILSNDAEKSSPTITLKIPTYEQEFLPNFREGDIVILYERNQETDNVTNKQIFKGSIQDLNPYEITIRIRSKQRNKSVLPETSQYAVEHDFLDSSYNAMYKGLYCFLNANKERKELLLNQRPPEQDESNTLGNIYDTQELQEIIYKAKIAKDYFLLIGPPGTGKTSKALKAMVEEFLLEPGYNILLLSYTNRAVDEICDALEELTVKCAYIRIGNELSCEKKHRDRLLSEVINDCNTRAEVRDRIESHRIFVGTVASISGKSELFRLKHFQVAIIDEASQILEPALLNVLSAKNKDGGNAIDKFILIGDQKQLPAVVLQNLESSQVNLPELNSIGLYNHRNSFFERLFNLHKADKSSLVWGMLHKQGRMHPEIALYPNYAFYNSQLLAIPKAHQVASLDYNVWDKSNPTQCMIATKRLVFISGSKFKLDKSNKINTNEAKITAKLVETIYQLYQRNKLSFSPDETIGIITPYRSQIGLIKREIHKLNNPDLEKISVDTVERYQGSQRDIIIYSFSVNQFSQLDFLSNNIVDEGQIIDRKLNVALTRAKKQLFITGNPSILSNNLIYFRLIEFIRSRGGYINATAEEFIAGRFFMDDPDTDVEIDSQIYEPDLKFKEVFEKIVMNGIINASPKYPTEILGNSHDYNRLNLIEYGRANFSQSTGNYSVKDKVDLYCFYNMRKHYFSSLAVFKSYDILFKSLFANSANRITFLDFGCGPMTSGLSFNQQFNAISNFHYNYIGIDTSNDMLLKAHQFAESGLFGINVKFQFKNDIEEVSLDYWSSIFSLSNTVILNFSYLFGNLDNAGTEKLASQINALIEKYPLNKYVLIYQNSALEKRNRTYINFKKLVPVLCSISEPKIETIRYRNAALSKYDKTETVYYEILSN